MADNGDDASQFHPVSDFLGLLKIIFVRALTFSPESSAQLEGRPAETASSRECGGWGPAHEESFEILNTLNHGNNGTTTGAQTYMFPSIFAQSS